MEVTKDALYYLVERIFVLNGKNTKKEKFIVKKLTEYNSQKIFFGVFIFSVILDAFGFLRTGGMSQNITDIIGISDSFQDYYLL